MREIVELIPVMNLTTIFLTYNSRDEQVQSLVEFLSSGVFTSMGEDLRNMEEYHRVSQYFLINFVKIGLSYLIILNTFSWYLHFVMI